MKVFGILFSMFCVTYAQMVSLTNYNESHILGEWVQVYSNRFVQETREVGWKCIHVNVTKINNQDLLVVKTGCIHNDTTSTQFKMSLMTYSGRQIIPNNITYPIVYTLNSSFTYNLQLRDYNEDAYDYLFFTGNDGLSLYIWTRNIVDFKINLDWKVLEKAVFLNYTGYYKFPMPSFTFRCLRQEDY